MLLPLHVVVTAVEVVVVVEVVVELLLHYVLG